MGIKLSTTPQPVSAADKLRGGFLLALGGALTVLQRVLLPHLLLALALFIFAAYALYHLTVLEAKYPSIVSGFILFMGLSVGGALALGYALVTATLYALKQTATYAENFFYELWEALKEKVRQQINSMEEGIAKQQAKVILDNSLKEVLAPLHKLRIGSVPVLLSYILLALLTFVSRSVFLAKLARTTGATIHFSTIFASRATLIGALFLNMRWLATLGLWMMYAIGILILLWSVYLVW